MVKIFLDCSMVCEIAQMFITPDKKVLAHLLSRVMPY